MNKIILLGRLTKDVERSALPANSMSVGKFTLAVNHKTKKDGDWVEEATFIRCCAFGKTADTLSKYCKKGSQILVEGRLQTSSWEKDGKKQFLTEAIVNSFSFCDGNKKSQDSYQPQQEIPY